MVYEYFVYVCLVRLIVWYVDDKGQCVVDVVCFVFGDEEVLFVGCYVSCDFVLEGFQLFMCEWQYEVYGGIIFDVVVQYVCQFVDMGQCFGIIEFVNCGYGFVLVRVMRQCVGFVLGLKKWIGVFSCIVRQLLVLSCYCLVLWLIFMMLLIIQMSWWMLVLCFEVLKVMCWLVGKIILMSCSGDMFVGDMFWWIQFEVGLFQMGWLVMCVSGEGVVGVGLVLNIDVMLMLSVDESLFSMMVVGLFWLCLISEMLEWLMLFFWVRVFRDRLVVVCSL